MEQLLSPVIEFNAKVEKKEIERHLMNNFLINKIFVGVLVFTLIPGFTLLNAYFRMRTLEIAVTKEFYFIVLSFFIPAIVLYFAFKQSTKQVMLHNTFFKAEHHYAIDYEFVRTESASITKKVALKDIPQAYEFKDYFVLYNSLSPVNVFLIPKRCIHSEEDIQRLRDIFSFTVTRFKGLSYF